jgi:hypothetical protein
MVERVGVESTAKGLCVVCLSRTGAAVIEIVATLPTNKLKPAVTGLEHADRKVV